MKILNKKIIAAYAEAMLDLLEHQPTMENTRNIRETLYWLKNDWVDESADDYAQVGVFLDRLFGIAERFVDEDTYLDYDADEFVYGLIELVRLGKR